MNREQKDTKKKKIKSWGLKRNCGCVCHVCVRRHIVNMRDMRSALTPTTENQTPSTK